MSIVHNIGYLLQHLSAVLAKQSDQVLQERLNIGFSQFKLLMVLERNPNIKQKDIAEHLGQTEASISRQIKLMHEQGLLQTTISPENRRQHITAPTARGLQVNDEALGILNSLHAPIFGRLSLNDQQKLQEILMIMHHGTCQPGKTGACQQAFHA